MARPKVFSSKVAADRRREAKAKSERKASAHAREIGPLPVAKWIEQRAACRLDLKKFLETFLRKRFPKPWGEPQLDLIAALEDKLLEGGRHAVALPRGSGKTTIIIGAAIWASLYGHRSYLVLIGATAELAAGLLRDYRAEIETNEKLAQAFPEVCYPIRQLEGLSTRRAGQTLNGRRTFIVWSDRKTVLPAVPDAESSGCVVQSLGLLGSLRGLVHKVAGRTRRPNMIVVDDFQTRSSATMPTQVLRRLAILTGDVLGLAGPGDPVSAFVAGTVISKGDGLDQLLDRSRHPSWQGVRVKLLTHEPTNREAWDEYARIRAEDLAGGGTGSLANTHYRRRRAELEAGGSVSWAARKLPGEVTAVQSAMNLRLDLGEAAFSAEYQNEPLAPVSTLATAFALSALGLAGKVLAGLARGVVPRDAVKLTCGIDFQDEVFPWLLVAWMGDGSGHIVDYGTHPEQPEMWSTAAVARPLSTHYPGRGRVAVWTAGLTDLTTALVAKQWERQELEDPARVEKIGIDAGWGRSTDYVYRIVRASPHAALLIPTHGLGIGAGKAPMALWAKKAGELTGPGYRIRSAAGAGRGRHLLIDTYHWKSKVADALRQPVGQPGGLTIAAGSHPQLFAHLTAEYPTPTAGPGRTVDVWQLRPDAGGQNHWWDCLVIAATLAAGLGVTTSGGVLPMTSNLGQPPAPVSLAKMIRDAVDGSHGESAAAPDDESVSLGDLVRNAVAARK